VTTPFVKVLSLSQSSAYSSVKPCPARKFLVLSDSFTNPTNTDRPIPTHYATLEYLSTLNAQFLRKYLSRLNHTTSSSSDISQFRATSTMAASATQNPPVKSDSKSSKKKKPKNASTDTEASTTTGPAAEVTPSNAATESNNGDGAYESPYIKELYKWVHFSSLAGSRTAEDRS
jgi:hypothetical protein